MSDRPRILVVDDEQGICDVLRILLTRDGYDVETSTRAEAALELFCRRPHDLVLQDIRMPGMDGLDLLAKIHEKSPDVPVIIMTAFSSWETAVEAMRRGAFDYLRKPFDNNADVRAVVQRALRAREVLRAGGGDVDEVLSRLGFLMGDSPEMQKVRDIIRRAAPTESSVLIEGESGVGKELAARSIHHLSPRASGPFVPVNCGGIPDPLLESELFGHVRGAFTGAYADKAGMLEIASGGTFFLDEIGEMSPSLQVKLLRVLEDREFKRVGDVQARRADVRYIAATNRDLDREIAEGRFRRDLYYRLKVITVRIPPLRNRRQDIPVLAATFLRRYATRSRKDVRGFSDAAKDALMEYSWPGNVRELENAVERAVALCEPGGWIRPEHLMDSRPVAPDTRTRRAIEVRLTPEGLDLERELARIEAAYLERALELAEGNATRAAQLLRMSLRSFRYRLSKVRSMRDR
jgi:two-component system response regulator PilR (NtrC family)